ncbi:hypothetical protein GQ53DRAFT_318231 [Thozetella sp. PMI_491]|nr:hypothetical protein GQ53DRAFT_318231 [Thozetella sp. PMI_491]
MSAPLFSSRLDGPPWFDLTAVQHRSVASLMHHLVFTCLLVGAHAQAPPPRANPLVQLAPLWCSVPYSRPSRMTPHAWQRRGLCRACSRNAVLLFDLDPTAPLPRN